MKDTLHLSILIPASFFENIFSIDWVIELSGKKASEVLKTLEMSCETELLKKKESGLYFFYDVKEKLKYQNLFNPEEKETISKKITELLLEELPDSEDKARQIADKLPDLKNIFDKFIWYSRTGDIFLKSFLTGEAINCYLKVFEGLDKSEDKLSDKLYITTTLKYSKIADIRFNYKKSSYILKNALKRSQKAENLETTAILLMQSAKNEWYGSNYEKAMECFWEGWEISKTIDNPEHRKSALTFSTFFHYWQGLFKKGADIYEQDISADYKFSEGNFSLMAATTVGYCLTMTGQIKQGAGMIDAVCLICTQKNKLFLKTFSESVMAVSLLNIRQNKKAEVYIKSSYKAADKWPDSTLKIFCTLIYAYYFFLEGDFKQTTFYMKKFLSHRERLSVSMWPYACLLEISWASFKGEIPNIKGLSLKNEIKRAETSGNHFLNGVAHRYKTFLLKNKKSDKLLNHLFISEKLLQESGHIVELARTRVAIGDYYFSIDNKKNGDKYLKKASKDISIIDLSYVPVDLIPLHKSSMNKHNLTSQLIRLGEKLTNSHSSDFINHIITTGGRIIGAERGGLFLKKDKFEFKLIGSANLTSEQIKQPDFTKSFKVINSVFETGKSTIFNGDKASDKAMSSQIPSILSVPVILEKEIKGVLYFDNRLLPDAFGDNHERIVSFFSSISGIAIKGENAKRSLDSILSGEISEKKSIKKENSNEMIGKSKGIKKIIGMTHMVGETDSTVLILGETGTGKELVAKEIHEVSKRKGEAFIAVNCNALPDNLISSELFGHEKGAFTGAHKLRAGRFEQASGGTLFIDEIGELPLETQIKLLRVLQTKTFERIGGTKTIHSDFRLICATNRNLEEEIKNGNFREDLYYRLNTFPILVPPLRERKDDIPLLASHFLEKFSLKAGRKFFSFPENEITKLLNHDWPGNIRELEHIIERGVILNTGTVFNIPELTTNKGDISHLTSYMTLKDVEKNHIIQILTQTRGKIRGIDGAAKILDLNPSTLYSKMKKLGIQK